MLTLDALTGNNDRHFYNWGVIGAKKKISKAPRFAPIFDSARGLLWNWNDLNVIRQYRSISKGGKKIENYINDASPRISIETNKNANHFELINFIKQEEKYCVIIKEIASEQNEQKVLKMLNKEFYPFFVTERRALMTYILSHRFKKIRS